VSRLTTAGNTRFNGLAYSATQGDRFSGHAFPYGEHACPLPASNQLSSFDRRMAALEWPKNIWTKHGRPA